MSKGSKVKEIISDIKSLKKTEINQLIAELSDLLKHAEITDEYNELITDRYRDIIRIGSTVQALTQSTFTNQNHPLNGKRPLGKVARFEKSARSGIVQTWVVFVDRQTNIEVWRLPKNVLVIDDGSSSYN